MALRTQLIAKKSMMYYLLYGKENVYDCGSGLATCAHKLLRLTETIAIFPRNFSCRCYRFTPVVTSTHLGCTANSSPIFEPAHHPSHSFSLTKLFSECKGCSFFPSSVYYPHFKTSGWSPNMWYSCWSDCTFLIKPTFRQNLMQCFGFRKINHILTETRMLKLVLRLRCVMIEL